MLWNTVNVADLEFDETLTVNMETLTGATWSVLDIEVEQEIDMFCDNYADVVGREVDDDVLHDQLLIDSYSMRTEYLDYAFHGMVREFDEIITDEEHPEEPVAFYHARYDQNTAEVIVDVDPDAVVRALHDAGIDTLNTGWVLNPTLAALMALIEHEEQSSGIPLWLRSLEDNPDVVGNHVDYGTLMDDIYDAERG